MARQAGKPANPKGASETTFWQGAFDLDQREAMIRDAAYYHYAKRGHAPVHGFDDWLAAEAEIERRMAESPEFPPDAPCSAPGRNAAFPAMSQKRSGV
jgi:hypothetical protein